MKLDRLQRLGFPPPLRVAGVESLDSLFPPDALCGIYVLHMADGRFYVGQSVNVVKRVKQHWRRYKQIEQVSFKPTCKKKVVLDLAELHIIRKLEAAGFPLLNIIHASITYQSSLFDDIVTIDEQRAWLDDPASLAPGPRRPVLEEIRAKYTDRFDLLSRRPDADRLVALMRRYVQHCIPRPHSTEPAYWSVSCLPAARYPSMRLACFNMNAMEVFVLGCSKDEPERVWAFINLSNTVVYEGYRSQRDIETAHPGAEVQRISYRAAGRDQLYIGVDEIDHLERLLHDPAITRAARMLNLHLMRKRTNLYARFHCYDLANRLLSPVGADEPAAPRPAAPSDAKPLAATAPQASLWRRARRAHPGRLRGRGRL